MRYLVVLAALLLYGCGSDNDSRVELERLSKELNPQGQNQAATKAAKYDINTSCFTKNDSYFYEKHLHFTLKDSVLVIGGGQCEVEYLANTPLKKEGNLVIFSGYTTFNQWFSDEFIQRITAVIHTDENYIDVNGIKFYVVPPPRNERPKPVIKEVPAQEDYIIKSGDTYDKLSKQFGISIQDLRKKNPRLLKGVKLKL